MLTRAEVIAIADECVFDIVEPDEYHDKREIADSGNLWVTERMERFAAAAYRKGVEDAAKLCDTKWDGDYDTLAYAESCNECAKAIRKLLEEGK